MADVATIKVVVDAADLKKTLADLESKGISTKFIQGGVAGGAQKALVTGQGESSIIEQTYTNLPHGTRAMMGDVGASQAQQGGWAAKLRSTFSEKNMKTANKSLFMMQMASLGVAFSFQSIIGSAMGLFSGLEDLGAMLSGGAMGTAYAELATNGENTTDIAATMGVTPEAATAAWAGFTAIINQFKAVIDNLMVKVLTPEMVSAILSVIDALATELAKPEVVKSIQELIKTVLDIALVLIPLIPLIANFVSWLGDTGLLGLFISIIFAAQVLLPLLAYFQFIFQAVIILTEVLGVLGLSLGWFFFWVGIIILVIDFLIHLFENLANGMDPLDAIFTAFMQTIGDLWNTILGVINPMLGFLGKDKIEKWDTSSGHETSALTTAKTNVTNITFAKSVNTADKKAATKFATDVSKSTYG